MTPVPKAENLLRKFQPTGPLQRASATLRTPRQRPRRGVPQRVPLCDAAQLRFWLTG